MPSPIIEQLLQRIEKLERNNASGTKIDTIFSSSEGIDFRDKQILDKSINDYDIICVHLGCTYLKATYKTVYIPVFLGVYEDAVYFYGTNYANTAYQLQGYIYLDPSDNSIKVENRNTSNGWGAIFLYKVAGIKFNKEV